MCQDPGDIIELAELSPLRNVPRPTESECQFPTLAQDSGKIIRRVQTAQPLPCGMCDPCFWSSENQMVGLVRLGARKPAPWVGYAAMSAVGCVGCRVLRAK
jgi:hypothetical protein